jgi:uncharacterized membrane protein (DUF485 family)
MFGFAVKMFQMEVPEGQSTRVRENDWDIVARDPEFQQLLAAKRRFIIPATVFFIVYYFALPILVGYAKDFMSAPVIGPVNLAYLFALSQFFMAWIIAALYMRAASRFDKMAKRLLDHLEDSRK